LQTTTHGYVHLGRGALATANA